MFLFHISLKDCTINHFPQSCDYQVKAQNYSFSHPRVNSLTLPVSLSLSMCSCTCVCTYTYTCTCTCHYSLREKNYKVVISEFPTPGHQIDSPIVLDSMVPADEKPELAHLSIFETKRQRGKKSSMQRRMMRIFHP